MASQSRGTKRKQHTIQTKYDAILEVEKGIKSKSQIAGEIGIPPNTLSTWLKKKEDIKKVFESQTYSHSNKRMRTSTYADVDSALDKFMRDARATKTSISGPILKAEAQILANKLGHTDFKASQGWLSRFKNRKGIHFREISGEAHSVNPEAVDAWKSTILPQLLRDYSPEDIYNTDETGLFYKMQPSKSLVYKDEDGRGGKASKSRITVLTTANMTGTHKVKPLVINNCQKPHIFGQKRVKPDSLPVDWQWNKKAWMTSSIFTAWLQKLDKIFLRQKRKVALVLDNCTAHPDCNATLKAIKLVFLPPNTTSVTQPMDQGIIASFKAHYRRHYVTNGLLKAMKAKREVTWTVLDAVYGIKAAWDQVTPSCIANGFAHCGFKVPSADPTPVPEEDDPEDDIPLAQLARDLREAGVHLSQEEEDAFTTVDNKLITSAPLTTEDIVEEVLSEKTPATVQDDEEDDEEETTTASAPVTHAMVMEASSTFKDALSSCTGPQEKIDEMWSHLSALDKFFGDQFTEKKKQATILGFFSRNSPTLVENVSKSKSDERM